MYRIFYICFVIVLNLLSPNLAKFGIDNAFEQLRDERI